MVDYLIRLQKFLSKNGIASRRKSEILIRAGRVRINNDIAKIGDKVGSEDRVYIDNELVIKDDYQDMLLAFNKPIGVVSSKISQNKNKTVFDFLPEDKGGIPWFLIGRLDINTSGLMLLTNNGDIANNLAHPSKNLDREYLVRARGDFNETIKQSMLKGILIDEKIHKFTDIVIGRRTSTNQWFTVCTKTGMNREVRKIFNAHNLQISRLKRVRFGPFFLPESLAEGQFVELNISNHKKIAYGK